MFDYMIDGDTELRLLSHADAQALFELAYENRQHLSEWMFWISDDYSLENAKQYIQDALDRFAANKGFELGIWVTGELAGCIRFNYIDWDHRNTELRYWIGSSFQGRGLATNACRALIDYAF